LKRQRLEEAWARESSAKKRAPVSVAGTRLGLSDKEARYLLQKLEGEKVVQQPVQQPDAS
jgi:hypothetical protein